MIILSHPTGNSVVRNTLDAFSAAGILERYWTCVCWNASARANRLLPASIKTELGRRAYSRPVLEKTRCRPWLEAGRLLAQKLALSGLSRHEKGPLSIDAVYRDLDRRVARDLLQRPGGTVYAYEDCACETFGRAKTLGMNRVYDLPIGYWRAAQAIQKEEAELQPEWAATLPATLDSESKCGRKDEELKLATQIVVASSFTQKTLSLAANVTAPVHVIPYGAPALDVRAEIPHRRTRSLRALYVGSLTQRKGMSYLLKAVEALAPHVELTLIGRPVGPCQPLDAALRKHRWIPSLPHAGILDEMNEHDVLLFPSLFEGFGLVLLEAMSRGMVVITTPHTGGPDVLDRDMDGFIVPIRSAEAIREKLEFLVRNPGSLIEMKHAARRKAERLTWASFGERLIAVVAPNKIPALP